MWQDHSRNYLRVSADSSHEADEIPQIVVNGYSFAERCQRLGKAIEWVKREVSLMRANDEQLTKEFHEMEALTMQLLPELTTNRKRSNTLPSSSRTSLTSTSSGYHGITESDESPQTSPKLKRPMSEYKKKPLPLYVSQSTTNLHESIDGETSSKDSFLKSSVSLSQLNRSDHDNRSVSADSGLAIESDCLNFDLSFSTDVFAALANIHGISMTNNSTSTTV